MIEKTEIGNKLIGFYRGEVVQHLTHGYCKIYIPSVYPTEWKQNPILLPPAELAASLFGGTNNGSGVFTYPNISSIVWCFFANNDLNYPVYFASSLGGLNACGQHAIILSSIERTYKDDDGNEQTVTELSSNRHLVTSGKTHIEWYEDGKLSVQVEDPDRRDALIDYNNDYIGLISDDVVSARPICEKVQAEELSNIHCKIVLDNGNDVYGSISVQTHHFDLLSTDNVNMRMSNDNDIVLDNTGRYNLEMLSTYTYKASGNDDYSRSHSSLSINVPGNTILKNCLTSDQIQDLNTSNLTANCNYQQSISGNLSILVFKEHNLTSTGSNSTDQKYKSNSTFSIDVPGYIVITSDYVNDIIEANSSGSSTNMLTAENSIVTKTADEFSIKLNKKHNLTNAKSGENSVENIEAENVYSNTILGEIDKHNNIQRIFLSNKSGSDILTSNISINQSTVDCKNYLLMDYTRTTTDTNGITQLTTAKIAKNCGIDGGFDNTITYNYVLSNGNTPIFIVDNAITASTLANDGNNADMAFNMTSKVLQSNTPIVLTNTKNEVNTKTAVIEKRIENNLPDKLIVSYDKIDATASNHEIKLTDGVTKNESFIRIDTKSGELTIEMKGSKGISTLVMKSDGTTALTTSDKLNITTKNQVNVETKDITFNGSSSISLAAPNISLTGSKITVEGSTTNITGSTGDCVIKQISLVNHIHPVPPHCPGAGITLKPIP